MKVQGAGQICGNDWIYKKRLLTETNDVISYQCFHYCFFKLAALSYVLLTKHNFKCP